jgi:hypothetical protein
MMKLSAAELTQQLALAQGNAALAAALQSRATGDQQKTVARMLAEARKAAEFFQGALTGLAAA